MNEVLDKKTYDTMICRSVDIILQQAQQTIVYFHLYGMNILMSN